jgi:hypothetical protein
MSVCECGNFSLGEVVGLSPFIDLGYGSHEQSTLR